MYRVPNSSFPGSITNYELITNELQNENKEIIIGTDQNADYLNTHCAYSKHLLESFFAAGLVPTITRPTRITIVQQPEGVTLQKYPQTRLCKW